jgi:hypothetical protein
MAITQLVPAQTERAKKQLYPSFGYFLVEKLQKMGKMPFCKEM